MILSHTNSPGWERKLQVPQVLRVTCIFLLALYLCDIGQCQSFYYKKYGVESGLPTEIIKGCSQDSLGYLWIATDEGVARYDGLKFKTYPDFIHNNYVKGFQQLRDDRLIVYGDLDLFEIIPENDSVQSHIICNATRIESDQSVSYPKYIFEDDEGALWVSEAQSVVRIKDQQLSRYDFGPKNRTTQFLRSFSIFEDLVGSLYVTSFQGNVFQFDAKSRQFQPYELKLPDQIEFVEKFGDMLVIGSSSGLYMANFSKKGGFEAPKLVKAIPSVSYVKPISSQLVFIATRGNEHYIADRDFTKFSTLPFSINNINNVFVSTENDIWLSSNEGLILLKENLFQTVGNQLIVESVTKDERSGNIFFATKENMYLYNRKEDLTKNVLSITDGYFQSLVASEEGIWVANGFKTFLFDNGTIKHEFDFSDQRMFVTELSLDSRGHVWLTIPGHEFAYEINKKKQLVKHKVPLTEEAVINVIKEGPNGIYVGSSSADSYLYFKAHDQNSFINISAPLEGIKSPNLEVTDLAYLNGALYLATSSGLIKYQDSIAKPVILTDNFTGLPVRSVAKYGDKLLFSNSYGLLIYDVKSNVVDQFNESYGIASRTITTNGIRVTEDENIWICTFQGLSFSSSSLSKTNNTKKPKILYAESDGAKEPSLRDLNFDYYSFITFKIAAITFPETDVNYQYKLGENEEWVKTTNEINLSRLSVGGHTLYVRAKKFGPYSWSEPKTLNFQINKPIWMQTWFIMLIALGIIGLTLVTKWNVQRKNRIANQRLQVEVNQKTKHLKELNEEKNKLIAVLGHDLRNPLSAMRNLSDLIAKEAEEGDAEFLKEIGQAITNAADRSLSLIEAVINWGKVSTQHKMTNEEINFYQLVNKVIELFQLNLSDKQINCDVHAKSNHIFGNRYVLDLVLRNLISNAIKFTPEHGNINVNLKEVDNAYVLEVTDSGVGMDEITAQEILQMDSKVTSKGTNNEAGTGLGLKLCIDAIHKCNGRIEVQSAINEGTTFRVIIPHQEDTRVPAGEEELI